MKGFSRFSPAVVAPVVLVVSAAFVRCIPNPDLSGLPPYDGGATSDDSGGIVATDSSFDSNIPTSDSGTDSAPADSATPVGTVSGIVIDYTQGNGKGVVPGATVTVSIPGSASATVPAAVTSDVNGLFTIPNVPAGVALQIGASKPTDLVNGIAYSTTFLVVSSGVPAGQTVNVFPALHEGCFQTYVLPGSSSGDAAANLPVTLQNATCPYGSTRSGAYAAMTFDGASFKDPVTNSLYSQVIRVEMIPLAYPPLGAGLSDLSWAVGLPGVTTPPGLLGAAEYRVVKSDPGQPDDGDLLALNNPTSDPVTIAVPVYASPSAGQALTYSYGVAAGAWAAETVATSAVQTGGPVPYVNIPVPHLTWWAATNGVTASTCVTGTLQAGGTLANVLVHATGVNYLGSSTAVTNSAGVFCLDVIAATPDGGAAQAGFIAEAISGGIPLSAASPTFSVTSLPSGATCASPTSCASLGAAITLTPSITCVSGIVEDGGGLSPLNVEYMNIPGLGYAESAGIQDTAYEGQVTLGANGSFCALAAPGSTIGLTQPGNPNPYCQAPPAGQQPIQVLNGTAAPACAAGGCSDAGPVQFSCNPPG